MSTAVIIAICGESGAGKSTTTGLLTGRGFRPYSLSAFLRAEAEAAHGQPTRPQVQAHGKAMQARHGNDYYARRLIEATDILSGGNAVVDGMRNLDELACLRRSADGAGMRLRLLALILDPEQRFGRVTGRARAGDSPDFAAFRADDARANGAEGDFQNNAVLIAAADWHIHNDGDIDALAARLDALVATATADREGAQ